MDNVVFPRPSPAWQSAARAKQHEIWTQIPEEWRLDEASLNTFASLSDVSQLVPTLISPLERQITDLSAHRLLASLSDGDFTCSEVLSAFCHRAAIAHQLTRCLSEVNFQAGQERARELDIYWREHHSPIGPLHGLPVSVTDRFHVEGLDSSCGFASWVGTRRTAADEGVLIQRLRKLGAVVFCKTNVPMSMMLGETANNIIGTTVNAYNRKLSAGGACGGEGALVALKGSPIGFGTDVAGSSRIPAAFNGLWALKCSEGRLPYTGIATVLRGLPTASGAIGVMANDLRSLSNIFQIFLDSKPWLHDVFTLELPWRQAKLDEIRRRRANNGIADGRLVFGVMSCDDCVQPHPQIHRAMALVTQALQNCGYEVVEWRPPLHSPAVENLFKIFGSTSAIEARGAINASGEPPIAQIRDWYEQGDAESSTTAEFWDLCDQRNKYRAQYAAYWESLGRITKSGRVPDGVVLPTAPTTAVRNCEFHYYGYSAIANVLDYPAITGPVILGDRDLDKMAARPQYLSGVDEKVQKTFSGDDIHGMPVGVQVMCPRLQEERLLGLMEALDLALATVKTR